ncbi:acyltransferase family-domain-containing protein [Dactylonectria macrodidyma]|uniref:Acyltransferase family-domain-containing protein n=1 Tax=Dactylonectria macrodidyma TaxID=307937 RepID=A0A9P9FMD4_9HYPO|nr:acyltransferase family-domain-containing protein [Dactylonectria macrodidyma]
MNGHALSRMSAAREENEGLLDRPSSPAPEAELRRSDDGILTFHRRFATSTVTDYIKSPVEMVRTTQWRAAIARFAWFCVPSFLQGRHMREQIRPAKLSKTAYLDGVRGLASFFVFFCHTTIYGWVINRGWGYHDYYYGFFRLPFFRLWYAGPPAVSVFFVISGYALSYKPIRLIRSGKTLDFSLTMSSMTFRRALRLFIPTTVSTFLIVCLIRLGAFEMSREIVKNKKYFRHWVESIPRRPDSAFVHFEQWAYHIYYAFKVFDFKTRGALTKYDVHLWTIPVEYRCSLYLFVVLLGTARLKTTWRALTVFGILCVTIRQNRWDFALFLCGMCLAEWDHIRGAHVASPALPVDEKQVRTSGRLKPIFWNLVSILGLYFMSQPDGGGEETPGWIFLTSLIPKWWEAPYRYYQSIGAVIFLLAAGYSTFWQRFFNSGFIQYLGKISYSLYLVHGPVMRIFGFHLMTLAWNITGVQGKWYDAGFALGMMLSLPVVITFADMFWRGVDIPSVKFARWFESKVSVKSD